MDVHPPKNGINRYWSIPSWVSTENPENPERNGGCGWIFWGSQAFFIWTKVECVPLPSWVSGPCRSAPAKHSSNNHNLRTGEDCLQDSLLILPRHRIASSEYLPWKSIAFSTKQHDIWIFQSANVHQMPKPLNFDENSLWLWPKISPLSLSLGPQHVRSTPSPAHEALKMRGSVLFPPSVASLHISEKTSTIEIIE